MATQVQFRRGGTGATGSKVTINMPTAFATESFATAIAVALG